MFRLEFFNPTLALIDFSWHSSRSRFVTFKVFILESRSPSSFRYASWSSSNPCFKAKWPSRAEMSSGAIRGEGSLESLTSRLGAPSPPEGPDPIINLASSLGILLRSGTEEAERPPWLLEPPARKPSKMATISSRTPAGREMPRLLGGVDGSGFDLLDSGSASGAEAGTMGAGVIGEDGAAVSPGMGPSLDLTVRREAGPHDDPREPTWGE